MRYIHFIEDGEKFCASTAPGPRTLTTRNVWVVTCPTCRWLMWPWGRRDAHGRFVAYTKKQMLVDIKKIPTDIRLDFYLGAA